MIETYPTISALLTNPAHAIRRLGIVMLMLHAASLDARAQARVQCGYEPLPSGFTFEHVPLPANNDAATSARFSLVDGRPDRNGASLAALHDGAVPLNEDDPARNFFFQAGSDGGRFIVDMTRNLSIAYIATFSWHRGSRGPQVYTLYAANGLPSIFQREPRRGTDPTSCGWIRLARVDTRPKDGSEGGGQHGVAIRAPSGRLGSFRYLLFDVEPTQRHDPFGHTFFSEIDVVEAGGPPVTSMLRPLKRVRRTFTLPDASCTFLLDATDAPDLVSWAEKTLRSALTAWRPKITALLSSTDYMPPTHVTLLFCSDMNAPAAASGGIIRLNATWFRRELEDEATGCVIHELVHVIQNYGRPTRNAQPPAPVPGWVVEGIADYIRWFLFEPERRGAEITSRRAIEAARYDGSYRVSANFLNWAVTKYDRSLITRLNAAAREERYDDALWQTWTGKHLPELDKEWKHDLVRRLPPTH